MVVQIDDYEVFANGTLVVNSDQTVSFVFDGLTIKFVFIKDETGEKRVDRNIIDSKTLLLHIYNFNNALGTGFATPIEIATLGNQTKVFILFAVYSISDELKVFQYTWLKRPVVQEGGNNE